MSISYVALPARSSRQASHLRGKLFVGSCNRGKLAGERLLVGPTGRHDLLPVDRSKDLSIGGWWRREGKVNEVGSSRIWEVKINSLLLIISETLVKAGS